ncbi:MAG: phosphate propanoyltransferase [Caldisericales bacterium]|nr:phosphate propanoyltransferase [Caldisericales bacterium]
MNIDEIIQKTWNNCNGLDINVGVSSRHVHLHEDHVKALFGHDLTCYKDLTQPGQYACNEKVDLIGPKGTIKGVRVLGPTRRATQVEVSKTDSIILGLDVPLRMSDDIEGTPGIKLVGEKGEIMLDKGVIVAKRHIHMSPEDAQKAGVVDGETVWVSANTPRKFVMGDIVVRVSGKFALDFHVDTDEANAAWLKSGDKIRIVR